MLFSKHPMLALLILGPLLACSQPSSSLRSQAASDSTGPTTNDEEQIATNPVLVTGRNLLGRNDFSHVQCSTLATSIKCTGFNSKGPGDDVVLGTRVGWSVMVSGRSVDVPSKYWSKGGAVALIPKSLFGSVTQGKVSLALYDIQGKQERSFDASVTAPPANTDPGNQAPPTGKVGYIFLTRDKHDAKFNGIASAGNICKTAAFAAGWGSAQQECMPILGSVNIAGNVDSRLPAKMAFPDLMPGVGSWNFLLARDVVQRLADGSFEINSSKDRPLGEESQPPNRDENGNPVAMGDPYWVGPAPVSGAGNSDDCADMNGQSWSDNGSIDSGGINKVQRIPQNWTTARDWQLCASSAHLICLCY